MHETVDLDDLYHRPRVVEIMSIPGPTVPAGRMSGPCGEAEIRAHLVEVGIDASERCKAHQSRTPICRHFRPVRQDTDAAVRLALGVEWPSERLTGEMPAKKAFDGRIGVLECLLHIQRGPVRLGEGAFSPGGVIYDAIVDEVDLAIDIPRAKAGEIADFGDWHPVRDHPKHLAVRATAVLLADARSDRECAQAGLALVALRVRRCAT